MIRRFYAEAEVGAGTDGYGVHLDGKPIRTPEGAALLLPSRALAEAIAGEWRAQGESIAPDRMPLQRLAYTAIDRVRGDRDEIAAATAAFAATDLLCYRADGPVALAARQAAMWQPMLDWLGVRHGAWLEVANGVAPVAQPAAALGAVGDAIAAFDEMMLAGVRGAASDTGSVVLALALAEGRIGAADAWEAAQIDEEFQIERWGEDPEAAVRRQSLRADLFAAAAFMMLCRA